MRKFLDEHGQKWVWPVWSQDSKIGKKLFQSFLGGPGQKLNFYVYQQQGCLI